MFEYLRVVYCHLGKHLSIKLDILFLLNMYQLSVCESKRTHCIVQSGYPQSSVSALFGTSVTIGIFSGFEDSFFCCSIMRLSSPSKPFGKFQEVLSSLGGSYAAFYSTHGRMLSV